jgi:hypothetical protein
LELERSGNDPLLNPLLKKVEQKIIDERIDKVEDIFAPLFLKVDKVE